MHHSPLAASLILTLTVLLSTARLASFLFLQRDHAWSCLRASVLLVPPAWNVLPHIRGAHPLISAQMLH